MLSFLFPSGRQITSALGALNAANIGISSTPDGSFSSYQEENAVSTLCLVLEDGRDPRTAIVASIHHGWSVVAISSHLDKKWEQPIDLLPDGSRFLGFRGNMVDFLAKGYELVQSSLCSISDIQRLVMICPEHGSNFDQLKSLRGRLGICDLRVLYNNVPVTIVSISSDEILQDCPLRLSPAVSFVDEDILTTNRRVQVWTLGACRLPVAAAANVQRNDKTREFLPKNFGSLETIDHDKKQCVPTLNIRRNANSKVAQLQKQKELALQQRIELSSQQHSNFSKTEKAHENSVELACRAQNYKPPRSSMIERISDRVGRCTPNITPKVSAKLTSSDNRRRVKENNADSSDGAINREKKGTAVSLVSLHTTLGRDTSQSNHTTSLHPSVTKTSLYSCNIVPPSSMLRNTSHRQSRIRKFTSTDTTKDVVSTMKKSVSSSSTSIQTESTANSSDHETDFHLLSHNFMSSLTAASPEYEVGDFVEVKIGNIYQPCTIDKQLFKNVYNVTLFTDTPAWNEKRSKVDIYQHCPERIPEVLARDIRPFTPARLGEVVYVFVNGTERKCCVCDYTYSENDELTVKNMKYVVKFATKEGEWWSEKHRVPVQRAYRILSRL